MSLLLLLHARPAIAQEADRAGLVAAARMAGDYLVRMQLEDGSFHYSYDPVEDRTTSRRVYNIVRHGGAVTSLFELYGATREARYLDAARRGALYLIEFQRRMNRPPSDAWLIQALEALHKTGREQKNGDQKYADQKYADHAFRLAERIMADQYTANDPAGYAGGFGPGPPRATPAAARAEGLLAAYRIARSIDDRRAARIAAALRVAARFQLSQQFTADSGKGLRNPERARGGFRESLTSMRIRIDYVQHNISSLLGVAHTLY